MRTGWVEGGGDEALPYSTYLPNQPFATLLTNLCVRDTLPLLPSSRTHYAEADNELHHLLIMESLGGNDFILDRILASAMAFGYYWYVVVVYLLSEQAAYHLSELIEDHAYNTYDTFVTKNEEYLKTQPVPDIARKYYERDNPFLFDLFCTVPECDDTGENFSQSRPKLTNLYDVFVNVRNDEREHWKTLCNLVQFDDMKGPPGGVTGKVQGTKADEVRIGGKRN